MAKQKIGGPRGGQLQITCATCKKKKWKVKSKVNNGKNGFNFCDRKCKDKAQRIGGIIAPSHSGKRKGYRVKAFRTLPHICNRCGYKRNERVLQVHHKDEDRTNSKISNLEILCPTCHVELHAVQRNKINERKVSKKAKRKRRK